MQFRHGTGGRGPDEALADHLFLLLEGAVARRGFEGTTAGLDEARAVASGLVGASDP